VLPIDNLALFFVRGHSSETSARSTIDASDLHYECVARQSLASAQTDSEKGINIPSRFKGALSRETRPSWFGIYTDEGSEIIITMD
jgi:hypothetical protein